MPGARAFRPALVAAVLAWSALEGRGAESPAKAPEAKPADPFAGLYQDYTVDFSAGLGAMQQAGRSPEEMKLSSEQNFFTLARVEESSRADALVLAAIEKEKSGFYREALEIYQRVIDRYPDALHRVSEWGVFVPIAEYCQLRILNFPKEHLDFYRAKHDARAKDAFDIARQQNFREGVAQIRDDMLATSYGGPALMTLGYSALDQGHALEALEYFERVWNYFPDLRTRTPDLALSMTLCRKLLETGETSGAGGGLVGHWKLDEGAGNTAADASGLSHTGTIAPVPNWAPGKIGSGLHLDWSNGVNVAGSRLMDIGVSGSDFSAAFWLKWESGSYPNVLFSKRGRSADEMFSLEMTTKNQILYTVATQSPVWERGATRGAVARTNWTHVAFVKTGNDVKLFLNGRRDVRETLKAPVIKNLGGVAFGHNFYGNMDDVRLYRRALLDREVAALAGTGGEAAMTAVPAAGEAPHAVAFSCPAAAADDGKEYFWEFGDGQTATGPSVRHIYGLGSEYAAMLTVTASNGAIAVARARISVKWQPKDEAFAQRMGGLLAAAQPQQQILAVQRTSEPNVSADDFVPMPPTTDPLGLKPPVWKNVMADSRRDMYVYTQPVVTKNSVIYRHKNILYCRSLLNGELRWKNDLGGRVVWQSEGDFQWPQEDILVQEGYVIAPMYKVGQNIVALDEITGRMAWAYGPMVAGRLEEANIRFGAAPAGGPQTVYTGYVLDNIDGNMHVDTEYGVMAFETATGRIKWRRPVCSQRPGLFSAGFARKYRNRIRSFFSPPLYHEGTVYYCTDAGAVTALDALSGRVKWVMLYPGYRRAHDATLSIYGEWYRPELWYNQRPLLIGDQLYVLPVDSSVLLCLDRRTGRILWNRTKMSGGHHYLAGAISTGEIVLTTYGRCRTGYDVHDATPPLVLLDPRTGKTVWEAPDIILWETKPVLEHWMYGTLADIRLNIRPFDAAARPFLTADDILYVPTWSGEIGPYWRPGCHVYHLTGLDLRNRTIVHQRRYLSDTLLAQNQYQIDEAPGRLKMLLDIPHKDDNVKREIQIMEDFIKDTVPVNTHGPFLPFARLTVERYGVPFELRLSARQMEMVYDREQVSRALAGQTDTEGLFARAELAVGQNRLQEAADLMVRCLALVSPEDLDFRAAVNQLLYQVHKELARAGVRSGNQAAEMANCLGMSRTVTTLADEVEAQFAVAQAAARRGDFAHAAKQLQNIASAYGQYEYPVPEIQFLDPAPLAAELNRMLDAAGATANNPLFGAALQKGMGQLKGSYAVYRSAVSPLPKTLTIRAGELAARSLVEVQKSSPGFAATFDREAKAAIGDKPAAEQIARLWEYPGTPTAQAVVEKLIAETDRSLQDASRDAARQAESRKRMWLLSDTARICGLTLPDAFRAALAAPPPDAPNPPLALPLGNRTKNLEESRGISWLVLERRDERTNQPAFLFLGGRVAKKLDNKFVLYCLDLATGEVVWKAKEKRNEVWSDEVRLQGKGEEPGFFEVFVHGDLAVVHGLFDVLAFDLKDGTLRWRFEAPFAFDIRHAVKSGDLLVLAGRAETMALYLPTRDPRGEVVWQEKEEGDIYLDPYFHGDRLVSLRKAPSNLTVRYRSTGRMMGRLYLPDLLLEDSHPLIENGPREMPVARDGGRLVASDGWYYLMLDVEKMAVVWKRLIDMNDVTRLPPMRLALKGDWLAVLKQDYDVKAIHMLSSRTGDLLWKTDPKDPGSPQPIYSMILQGDKLYGLRPHPGQAFYFAAVDAATGRNLFAPNEQKGYGGKPEVELRPELHGECAVALVKDRQDYEVKAFDLKDGRLLHTLKTKATGDFGEHGRVSATAQHGALLLLGGNDLTLATKK